MITYDVWLDTGGSYKLIGSRFNIDQLNSYVKNLTREQLEYTVISDESGVFPVFTRANKWFSK